MVYALEDKWDYWVQRNCPPPWTESKTQLFFFPAQNLLKMHFQHILWSVFIWLYLNMLTSVLFKCAIFSTVSLATLSTQYALFEWIWEPWKDSQRWQADIWILQIYVNGKNILSCIVWRTHVCIAKRIFQVTINLAWTGSVRVYMKHPSPIGQCLDSSVILDNSSNFIQ